MPLRRYLATHSVTTAFELGWSQLNNGELLTAAEAQFDALITTDQHLDQHQNLLNRKLLFWCYRSRAGRSWERYTSEIVSAIESLKPGDYVLLDLR